MTVGVTANPFLGASLIYLSRRTSKILADPKVLDDVMTVLDPNSPASQIKVATLKMIDGLISDSTNDIEKNELSSYREFIETAPLDEIKKGIEDTLQSSQEFLTSDNVPKEETPAPAAPVIPTTPLPETPTPNLNMGSLQQINPPLSQTGLTSTEQALLSPEEQSIRLRQRGMA